ncbi:hypothetical protein GCM10011316_13550 [Roseibium aquae]|uniref:PilZ domain-containing protein n=1 Tax=Roseibium aquae TaxID=1323746 RepID=A0A916TF20_9HYPH|nr:PilZ domain-containing protein [Roseibium aquae]GGB42897.1 hypothetical protein GCM10011316_13550 [Roseibium aquae]
MDVERRTVNRAETRKQARIIHAAPSRVTDCLVRNASAVGALLVVPEDAVLPTGFLLDIPEDQALIPTKVIWREGSQVGVRFVGQLEQNEADQTD